MNAVPVTTNEVHKVKIGDLCIGLSPVDGSGTVIASYQNPRRTSGLDAADIKELADNIAEYGLQTPLKVRWVLVDGQTRVVVEDGQRRYRALQHLARQNLLADDEVSVIGDPTPVPFTPAIAADMLTNALSSVSTREALSSYELVLAGVQLRAGGRSNEQIGKIIRRSPSWVSRMLGAYTKASPEVISAWRDGKIPDEQFRDIVSTGKVEAQEKVLMEVVETRASGGRAAAAEARQAAKLAGPAPTPRAERAAAKAAEAEAKAEAKAAKAAEGGKNGTSHKPTPMPVPAVRIAPEKKPRPGMARIEEFALLRAVNKREPYLRGLFDMAAFVIGEITEADFLPIFRTFVKTLEKASAKGGGVPAKPARKEPKAKPPKRKGKKGGGK
jgi:ParB-like chromosome segregation protein Spo0J